MNTTQLECFMEVADTLNFSRAADHLRLTQPAVSHQIRTLENELGVTLFHRTSKTVRLSREGQMFLQYAGDILKLTGESAARVRRCQAERPVELSIGCRSAVDLELILPALERLRREEPRVIPRLRLVPTTALDNLLAEGEVEVMLTFQETAPQNSVYRELLRCPVACVCRPDHPLAATDRLRVEDLTEAGRIAVSRPPACPPTVFALQGPVVTASPPEQVIFCDNMEVLLTMAEAGYAFGIMAVFPGVPRPGLCCRPLEGCQPLSYGAAWRRGDRTHALRRFLALLEETVGQDGGEQALQ